MSRANFTAVRSEGGLLPGDLLMRIGAGDKKLPGADKDSYDLLPHETLGEAINRSWARLVGAWRAFQEAAKVLPESDRGTSLVRDRWLLPLFQELGYGRLSVAKAVEVDGQSFAVSHARECVPIHLVSFRYELDKRLPGVAGAATSSPHGLLQDLLNRSDAHLWGFVSNGMVLRVLRDHHSMTRKAYVEFDLAQIFDGDLYSEFRLLWLVCHASRVRGDKPGEFLLEKWFEAVQKDGVQALDQLRVGVEKAITALGTGFLRHPANRDLRERLERGGDQGLGTRELYRQLLRLVYQLIFVFVAEDRGVLLDPSAPEEARQLYAAYYSTRRLRDLAVRKRGGPHGDLWVQLSLVLGSLYQGRPQLALPAYGSFLWRSEATAALSGCALANEYLLDALRALNTLEEGGIRRPVAWNLVAADELGGIYESLMELHPVLNKDSDRETFTLETAPGHERKTTGSYYTPTSLVDCLLDSALDPVLDEAEKKGNPEKALLDLKVVDPACGSGHFLVAAARRIAERLARVRTGDAEPAPRDYHHAIRDVVGRCIYGVDLNEMAVELCKVALWMEAIEPGKPLSFLDGHIQHGNALLGATPKLLNGGIPDDAWSPITGDDKDVAKELKKRNKDERKKQLSLLARYAAEAPAIYDALSGQVRRVEEAPDDNLEAVRAKESSWRQLTSSPAWKDAKFVADLWCSAFVWPKVKEHKASAPTFEVYRRAREDVASCPADTREQVKKLAKQYQLFHWHLAFPAVFNKERGEACEDTGWLGGFDVVLGNPPWERIKLHEKEFFSVRAPEIAGAANAAARKKAIEQLRGSDPVLWGVWQEALCQADGESSLVRDSGRYPLCGRGDINTYAIFAELNRGLLSRQGRAGFITPTGLATDATTSDFIAQLIDTGRISSLRSYENFGTTFGSVNNRQSFCLTTLSARPVSEIRLEFIVNQELPSDAGPTEFSLTPTEFRLLNPNTVTCPTFRTRRDAEINKAIYRRVPVLWRESEPDGNPWGISFKRMFDMSNDSNLFYTREEQDREGWHLDGNTFVRGHAQRVPLYEAKMIHHFNHRFATLISGDPGDRIARKFEGWYSVRVTDPNDLVIPHYWVDTSEVIARLEKWDSGWLIGWRDICRSTDLRTAIVGIIPRTAVGNTTPLIFLKGEPSQCAAFYANMCSFVLDYATRQKLGGTHLNYVQLKQLPILSSNTYSESTPWDRATILAVWFRSRVLELAYTAWDLSSFAEDLNWDGAPFRWNEERRLNIRSELDAAFFHLYGIIRKDVAYIMETFPVVKNNDEKVYNTYRTKNTVLDVYDQMQRAIDTGVPYQTILDPPPAHPSLAHSESTRPTWAKPRIELPELPAVIPAVAAEVEAPLILWALLRSSRDQMRRADLARAFALRSQPELLVRCASPELREHAEAWAAKVNTRKLPPGILMAAIDQLASRSGIRLATDAAGRSLVETTEHTPSEDELPDWARYEARLALAVARSLDTAAVRALAEAVSPDERELLAAEGA